MLVLPERQSHSKFLVTNPINFSTEWFNGAVIARHHAESADGHQPFAKTMTESLPTSLPDPDAKRTLNDFECFRNRNKARRIFCSHSISHFAVENSCRRKLRMIFWTFIVAKSHRAKPCSFHNQKNDDNYLRRAWEKIVASDAATACREKNIKQVNNKLPF